MTDYPVAKKLRRHRSGPKTSTPRNLCSDTLRLCGWPGDQSLAQDINLFLKTIKRDGRLLKAAKNNGLEPVVNLN